MSGTAGGWLVHLEAASYVALTAHRLGPFDSVLELGGLNINGSVRPYFPGARYVSVDIVPGPGVDVVADATTYRPEDRFDAVVCAEVLEHVPDPDGFVATAWGSLRPGGLFILTAACPPRAPHSAVDGGPLRAGEYYKNVEQASLAAWLVGWKDVDIEVHADRGDIYATAVKP
jgi:SAM-dependent methyltransferase